MHLFSEEEQPAVDSYIHAAIIPFLGDTDCVIGTGTLVASGQRLFVVTAAHVFDNVAPASLRLGLRQTRWVRTDAGFAYHRVPGADIAVIELVDQETRSAFARHEHRPIEFPCGTRFDPTHSDYLVVGFPHHFAQHVREQFLPGAAHIVTKPFHGHFDSALDPLNPTTEFLLNHGTGDGSSRPVHPLPGISGATVWAVQSRSDIHGIWSPQAALSIVGIQHAYSRNNYLRCHHWSVASTLLEELVTARR
jgi:hypothetical protein